MEKNNNDKTQHQPPSEGGCFKLVCEPPRGVVEKYTCHIMTPLWVKKAPNWPARMVESSSTTMYVQFERAVTRIEAGFRDSFFIFIRILIIVISFVFRSLVR